MKTETKQIAKYTYIGTKPLPDESKNEGRDRADIIDISIDFKILSYSFRNIHNCEDETDLCPKCRRGYQPPVVAYCTCNG